MIWCVFFLSVCVNESLVGDARFPFGSEDNRLPTAFFSGLEIFKSKTFSETELQLKVLRTHLLFGVVSADRLSFAF